jgi:pre-mRNA-splicing factor CDC5/CEF1
MRSDLRAGLSALPAPQNEYAIEAPELEEEEEVDAPAYEEDAADAKARRRREAEAARAAEERKRSSALRRGLPRPRHLDGLPPPRAEPELAGAGLRERAEEEVARELARLLQHDASRYPPAAAEGGGGKRGRAPTAPAAAAPPLEPFSEEELATARELLAGEAAYLRQAYGHAGTPVQEYESLWSAAYGDLLYVPSERAYGRAATAKPAERAAAGAAEHAAAHAAMAADAKRVAKLEAKVGLVLGGLQQRDAKQRGRVDELWGELEQAHAALAGLRALHARELLAAPERLDAAAGLLAGAREREAALQERFKALSREQAELLEAAAGGA